MGTSSRRSWTTGTEVSLRLPVPPLQLLVYDETLIDWLDAPNPCDLLHPQLASFAAWNASASAI